MSKKPTKPKLPKRRSWVAVQARLKTGAGTHINKAQRGTGKGAGKAGRHPKHKKSDGEAKENPDAPTWFRDKCVLRYCEVQVALNKKLPPIGIEFGEYSHFETPRGFAVTFFDDRTKQCSIRFARKLLSQQQSRIEGILRHELGHVVDFLLSPQELVAWMQSKGGNTAFKFGKQDELLADEIARLIWGTPILYDPDTVHTLQFGTPRPKAIGW